MEIISSETKKVAGTWSSKTTLYNIPKTNGNERNAVEIFTTKSRNCVVSTFQFGDYAKSEMFSNFTFIMFQDRRGTIDSIEAPRVSKNLVSKQHSLAIRKFMDMMKWDINQ
jgi:hypothetical protein